MVVVKDLTELTLRDLWREVKEEEDWWQEISKRTLNIVKLILESSLEEELLDREIFTTLEEATILIEQWRKEYNQVYPHTAKNYRPPVPETIITTATM